MGIPQVDNRSPAMHMSSIDNLGVPQASQGSSLDTSVDLPGTQPYSHGSPELPVPRPTSHSDPPSAESERTLPYTRSDSPYSEMVTPAMLTLGHDSSNENLDKTDPYARSLRPHKDDDFQYTFETDSAGKPIKYFISDTQMMPVVSTEHEAESHSLCNTPENADRAPDSHYYHFELNCRSNPAVKKNKRKGRRPKRACEVVKNVFSTIENEVKKSGECDITVQDTDDHQTQSESDQTPEHKKTDEGKRYKLKHPVKCRFCDKIFWSHTGRYYHEAVHTGKWVFTCKYCKMGFMQRKAYDSHMRARHKPRVVEVLATTNEESLGLVLPAGSESCEKKVPTIKEGCSETEMLKPKSTEGEPPGKVSKDAM